MMGVIFTVAMMAISVVSAVMGSSPLDALLQEYAYGAFVGPRIKTGVAYDGIAPSNLTGIGVSAMRLRSGSLRSKGVKSYNEFEIPMGVIVHPYVERLVLVYQNLGNWSMAYYPPPPGYVYLAPVLGLVAYDASDLTAKGLPVLDIHPSEQPISVHFDALLKRVRVDDEKSKKCVLFDLDGSLNLTDVLSDNVCATFQQGHFSIVVEEGVIEEKKKNDNDKLRVWILVGSVVGVILLLVLVGVVVWWVMKYRRRRRLSRMERAADGGEALRMTPVGHTRAPSATGTRTQPTLETEYVP